jgi:hypothetical protein
LGFGVNIKFGAGATIGWATMLFLIGGMVRKVIAGISVVRAARLSMRQSWYAVSPEAMADSKAAACCIGLQAAGAGAVAMGLKGYDGLFWMVLALVLCVAAEVWGRWRFYDRYARIGM